MEASAARWTAVYKGQSKRTSVQFSLSLPEVDTKSKGGVEGVEGVEC